MRDTILDVIQEEKRQMFLSVYDEMRAEGQAAGKAISLLKLLAHRGLAIDDALRARITACTNEAKLDRWFDRALTAATVAEIFDEP